MKQDDIICKCGDDIDYHNENGCMMYNCKCKKKGLTYHEHLNKINGIKELCKRKKF